MYVAVLQAYVRKQAQCLLDIAKDCDSSSLANLQRWSLEFTALFFCYCIGNPKAVEILHDISMQDGTVCQEPPANDHKEFMVSKPFGMSC